MARSKSYENWSSASSLVSEHSVSADAMVEGNCKKNAVPATVPSKPKEANLNSTQKKAGEEWDRRSPTCSFDGGEDETSASSSVTSGTHSIGSDSLLPQQMLPTILLKQHSRTAEDEKEGWRIRSRYLHSLGVHSGPHHDHPSLNRCTQSLSNLNASIDCSASIASFASLPTLSHGYDATLVANPPPAMALKPSTTQRVLLKGDYGRVDRDLLEAVKKAKDQSKADEGEMFIPDPIPLLKTTIPKKKVPGKSKRALPRPKSVPKNPAPVGKLSFDPAVIVREIPSHRSYSERIRKTIWMLTNEYEECITKNAIEYMSEGFEPSGVVEESDFVLREGKLVHPVCLLLDEPENTKIKEAYFGTLPVPSAQAPTSSQQR